MRKVALFAFNGEIACFVHVMLNAVDMKERGWEVKIILEGEATELVRKLAENRAPFGGLYARAKEQALFGGVCGACAAKTGSLEEAEEQGFDIYNEMSGHPSIARFIDEGYEVLVF